MVPIVECIKLRSKCVSMQVRQIKSCRVPFSFRISNAVYHITAFQVVSIIYIYIYATLYFVHKVSYYSCTVLLLALC